MVRALVIALLLSLNLALWGTLIFLGGFVKLVTWGGARRRVILALAWMAERWVTVNNAVFDLLLDTRWVITGVEGLRPDGHYLVMSNHLSWVDIFAVVRAFHRKAPFIRFFLKRPLLWAPFVGQACWALEFPFMRRYSSEYLAQHPEKRGLDLETTRTACRRYQRIPVTILNYVEGTRFSRDKQEDQQSPYQYLLRPRIGGIGFVLASLAEELDALLDVTIVYPRHDVTMWDFVTNRVPSVRLHARRIEVPAEFTTSAITQRTPERDRFGAWVEQIWREKDAWIAAQMAEGHSTGES